MANFYSVAVACDVVPADMEDFERLNGLLNVDPTEGDPSEFQIHGFELEYLGTDSSAPGCLILKAPETCEADALPKKFLKAFGKVLKKAKLKHLQVGVAQTCDKLRPGTFGGYYFRIMQDGRLVGPKVTWPR